MLSVRSASTTAVRRSGFDPVAVVMSCASSRSWPKPRKNAMAVPACKMTSTSAKPTAAARDLFGGFGKPFDGRRGGACGVQPVRRLPAKRGAIPRSRRFREKEKSVRSWHASRTFYFTGSRESCRPICAIPIPDARSRHRPKKKSCRY